MDYAEEVQEVLGKENLSFLKNEIKQARINIDDLEKIARKMSGAVYGTYDAKKRAGKTSVDIFRYMLDTWYNDELYNEDTDGFKKLVDILRDEDVDKNAVAIKLKPLKPLTLNIGLPDTHFLIPQSADQEKTGTRAYPSNQGQSVHCASHAVGKAILEILDSIGWDANQEAIIDALKEKVQPETNQRANPNEFTNVKIKVVVTKQKDSGNKQTVSLVVKVQTQLGKRIDDHFFRTIPGAFDLMEKRVRMVLRWDYYVYEKNSYDPHAVYAEDYDTAEKVYSCINSWGKNNQGRIHVPNHQIAAIYYISIIQEV